MHARLGCDMSWHMLLAAPRLLLWWMTQLNKQTSAFDGSEKDLCLL
jgi:hypothetical protein